MIRRFLAPLATASFALACTRSTPPTFDVVAINDACTNCGDATDAESSVLAPRDVASMPADDAALPVVSIDVNPNPGVATGAVVMLHTSGAIAATIHYAVVDTQGDQTVAIETTDGDVTVPIIGLVENSDYTFFAVATDESGRTAQSDSVAFHTLAIPTAMPVVHVGTNVLPGNTDALLLSVLCFAASPQSVAVIVDRNGRYLWYRRGGQPSSLGFDVQRWAGGNYTVYQYGSRQFEELDLTSAVKRTWSLPSNALGLDGHDLYRQSDQSAIVMAPGTHSDDTSQRVDGGLPDATVMDFAIHQIDPSGTSSLLWSSWPTITLAESTNDAVTPGTGVVDALHPNSIAPLANGKLLVSLRHTDELLAIDPIARTLVWRMGGTRSDFSFVNDPFGGFSHQHYARQLPNGHILLLDNGNGHSPPQSRVVEYAIDEAARTATMVWQYVPSPAIYASAGGSVVRLENGHTLIAWGLTGITMEIDDAGTVVWQSLIAGCMVYRAQLLTADDL